MIIGLGHQSRVGKDTCGGYFAELLRDRGREKVMVTSFALLLKDVTHRLFKYKGVHDAAFYEKHPEERTREIPGLGKNVVDIWIEIGQRMRDVYEDVWLDAVVDMTGFDALVIRDVRFPNEAEAIRARGGVLVKVTRPGQVVRGSDTKIPDDYDWDYVIENTGTLQDLQAKCADVIGAIYGSQR